MNLPDLLAAKWKSKAAMSSANQWLTTKNWGRLHKTYALMLPLIRLVGRRSLFGVSRDDVDDVESMAAYRLWRTLRRRKYPEFVSLSDFESFWRVSVRNMLYSCRERPQAGTLPPVEDIVMAERAVNVPRDGAAISVENTIFLEELPDAIWRDAADDLAAVYPAEAPVLRYIIHSLFAGRQPDMAFLQTQLDDEDRIRFLRDYGVYAIRSYMRRILDSNPESVLGHPVSFISGYDNEESDATE